MIRISIGRRLLSLAAVIFTCMSLWSSHAMAHRPSDAFLILDTAPPRIAGQWDIALRDLDQVIGLDADQNGQLTWAEVKAQHVAIAAYALSRLELRRGGLLCRTHAQDQQLDRHEDLTYAVLRFEADCGGAEGPLEIVYDLLFDIDRLHRGLLQVRHGEAIHNAVLGPDNRRWQLQLEAPDLWRQAVTYLKEGVWHIWIGYDHILFLITLLLPAVLIFQDGRWEARGDRRAALIETAKVVTSFTAAHSLTLFLAASGWLVLPSALVESAIAVTVILAAVNNLRPVVRRHLWLVTFFFGLIHGVGFAGVLAELGLPAEALLLSLLSFNLGVEVGQLAIVAAFLPAASLLAGTAFYRVAALWGGSLVIAAVGLMWLAERSLSLSV